MKQVLPAITLRDNEFYGDLAAWNQAHSVDNTEQMERLARNLREARRRELTDRQEEMLHLYYDLGLTITKIAALTGVCTSTVSRTLHRAREKLFHCLQYSF